jgi:hypothetical protein
VQYRVRENGRAAVRAAIRAFVHAIAMDEPGTRCEAYEAADGVTYLHLMRFADPEAERGHRTAAHTARFTEILYPRCEKPPSFVEYELVDSTATTFEAP